MKLLSFTPKGLQKVCFIGGSNTAYIMSDKLFIFGIKILSPEKSPALEPATGDETMTEEEWNLRVAELNKHQVPSLHLIILHHSHRLDIINITNV